MNSFVTDMAIQKKMHDKLESAGKITKQNYDSQTIMWYLPLFYLIQYQNALFSILSLMEVFVWEIKKGIVVAPSPFFSSSHCCHVAENSPN